MEKEYKLILDFIKKQYPLKSVISLHEPVFLGNERKYVLDAIDSTFVSSIGKYVDKFEEMMCNITGAKYCIAMVNGTNALHLSLLLANVITNDEVLTQSFTFIATANAINYIGARPVFIDIDPDTLGMSAKALEIFLQGNAEIRDGQCYNLRSNRRISACVPMHTFGFPCRIEEIVNVCNKWKIALVEDSAESIGSFYKGKHTGTFGKLGVFSFNGNKTVTSGGGGAIITNNEEIAKFGKHLSTQAKVRHKWEFVHDYIGYNYRMPNINAALLCGQLEQLNEIISDKRALAKGYCELFANLKISYFSEPENSFSNYWLNTIVMRNIEERNSFLEYANSNNVLARPAWELMNKLAMFNSCQTDGLKHSNYFADRIVNLPSGSRIHYGQ